MDWMDVPPRLVCQLVAACNGHNIFAPEELTQRGVPRELIDRAVGFHSSDFRMSTTLIVRHEDGKLVGAMTGVHDLDLLSHIAQALGVSYERERDSRSQAQALKEAIQGYYVARDRPFHAGRTCAVSRPSDDPDCAGLIR